MKALTVMLAVAAEKGCACGIRPCLIHYAEQNQQERNSVRRNDVKDQEEFYGRPDSSAANGDRRVQQHGAPARVPGDRGGNRDRPANPVRKSARKSKR